MEYFSINMKDSETKEVTQITGCLPTLQNTNTCISCNLLDSCNAHIHTQMHMHNRTHTHSPKYFQKTL